jgi:hypothetical protein
MEDILVRLLYVEMYGGYLGNVFMLLYVLVMLLYVEMYGGYLGNVVIRRDVWRISW